MTRLKFLLGLSIAAGLVILVSGCLKKTFQEAHVEVDGDAITFPAYTIVEGELEAPAQGPFVKFTGEYPQRWPSEWKLDDRFYISKGSISEVDRSYGDDKAVSWEFEGVFNGTADDLSNWFIEESAKLGVDAHSHELNPVFKVIERSLVSIPKDAWDSHGLFGEMNLSYGPRYGGFTYYLFSVAQRLEDKSVTEESQLSNVSSEADPDGEV